MYSLITFTHKHGFGLNLILPSLYLLGSAELLILNVLFYFKYSQMSNDLEKAPFLPLWCTEYPEESESRWLSLVFGASVCESVTVPVERG